MRHETYITFTNELLAFDAVYFSQFGCCNSEILLFSQDKSRYQLCHFSLNAIQSLRSMFVNRLYWFRWIQLCRGGNVWESWLYIASDSSFACWISNTIEISMCNINSDIGTTCQFWIYFQTRSCFKMSYNFIPDVQ